MSAGTTVIASDLGAFERVLDNGQAGYMFRTNDPNDLARAVIEALNNPTERTQRTQRATEFVQQFDWKEVTTKILTVYEMVLSASTALGKVTEDPSALTHPREAS